MCFVFSSRRLLGDLGYQVYTYNALIRVVGGGGDWVCWGLEVLGDELHEQ